MGFNFIKDYFEGILSGFFFRLKEHFWLFRETLTPHLAYGKALIPKLVCRGGEPYIYGHSTCLKWPNRIRLWRYGFNSSIESYLAL